MATILGLRTWAWRVGLLKGAGTVKRRQHGASQGWEPSQGRQRQVFDVRASVWLASSVHLEGFGFFWPRGNAFCGPQMSENV